MTDRDRQLGASTAAPELAEPCTECRGFANVPQMLRGRWARGDCHACGGAGTRGAQAGRKLPLWDARGWIDTPYPEPTTPAGAVETVRVSDPLPSMADYGRHLDAIAEVKLGIDAWNSRRAPWAAINEPPKPEPPTLLEQVREAAPMFRWEPRYDRPAVHAHAGNVTVEVCRLGPNLYAILCAGAMERGLTSARVADLPTVLRELVRHPDCPPDASDAVLALLDQCP